MKGISCIVCDQPAVHACKSGNTLCAGCARKIRNSKISVSLANPNASEKAAGATSSPGSLAPAAPKSTFARA